MVTENININSNFTGDLIKKLSTSEKKLEKFTKQAIKAEKALAGLSKSKKSMKDLKADFKLASKRASVLRKETALFNKQLEATTYAANAARVPLGKLGESLNFKRNREGLIDFNGDMLSLMFLGMAMQGVFQGALGAIFDGYKQIIPENTKFNRKLTEVVANFEFFKFQLADAFANSALFTVLTDAANSFLGMTQNMSEEMRLLIVEGLLIGLVASAFLTWLGIMSLGVASLSNIGKTWKKIVPEFTQNLRWIIDLWTSFAIKVKNFSFTGLVAKLKAFGSGGFSSVGEFFTNVIKNIKNFIKTAFAGGFIKGIKNVFTALKNGGKLQFVKTIKGFTSFFKLTPLGWILVGIQTIFESIASIGNKTFDSGIAKATALVISLVINLIENIIQSFAELVDIIINIITSAIETAAKLLGFDIEIPTLDLGGMIDGLGSSIEDLAVGWLESDSPSGNTETTNITNNNYYVGSDNAAVSTVQFADAQQDTDILAPISR